MSDAFAEAEALLLAAREHPTAFACLTNPAYRPAPFHWRIGDVLRDVALGREDRVILTMPPRHGKALALDTPVPTPSGWTTMGELRPGDQVFDERGVPCAVVAVSPVWRDRPVYRVITDDGDAIVADAEHEWVARLDGKRPVFHRHTTAVIARPRCKRAMVIRQGALDLPAVDLPIDPYVLGLWLGDGRTGYGSITAGDADRAFVRFEVERAGYRTRMQPSGEDTFSLTGFQRELGAAGVLKNKHIPPVYLRASAEQRRALLQGLIDSDGYVAPGGQIEFCNTNRRLADGVRELVRSLGCKTSLIEGRATLYGKDCGPRYRVHFYLAGAARLPRKAANCRDGVRSPNRYITAVSAGTANTVCIQVDSPSHMFLCGRSMLPTHNSELVSVRFPAWYLGRLPNRRIIAASYAAPLASDFGRKARNIIGEDAYRVIFPGVTVAQDSSAANRWDIAGRTGGYIAAGVGGPITGRGANCLSGDTLILTEAGPIEIAALVRVDYRGRVLSFNHATGRAEWRAVQAVRETVADEVVELVTSGGRTLRATGNHRIYTDQRGYREACVLQDGDGLTATAVAQQQDLCAMRSVQARAGCILPAVLSTGAVGQGGVTVRTLRDRVRASALRVREDGSARAYRCVLLAHMFARRSRRQVAQALRVLRNAEGEAEQQVLHGRLPAGGHGAEAPACRLRSVRRLLCSDQQPHAVLQPDVRHCGTFASDDGRREFALQGSAQLRRMVPADAAGDHGTGRPPLCCLRSTGRAAVDSVAGQGCVAFTVHDSSRQRGCDGQHNGESGDALWHVPYCSPQVERDTISRSRRVRAPGIRVYDLQVEGNRNFFANGILVHNCLLIDDPFKNREEADSQVIRDSVWDWYTSTAYTRLERDIATGQRGSIVVVQTRWHEDDLAGRLLGAEDGDQWTVINFPAMDEVEGTALWPEKYDAPELDRIRRTIGSRDWSALYQQRPAPLEGGLLKRHWWRYWAEPSRAGSLQPVRYRLADDREVAHHPVPRPDLRAFDEILQSWDMAFKDTKASAFVVGQVWGRRGADRYLLTQVRGKWDFATTCKVVTRLNNVWGEGRVKLVEDKANGSAVISALRHTIPGFVAVEPHGGKEARASAVAPIIESGNVYIPHPAQAAWVDGFVNECATFPSGTYADQVDAMTQALTRWMRTAAVDRLDRGRVRPVRQKYEGVWRPVW